MTEDEVSLIYEYLHENYEYREGELIAKNPSKGGRRQGLIAGGICIKEKCRAYYNMELRIDGKRIAMKTSHLIYIYHYRIKPYFVIHKDGNQMNCKIENLENVNKSKMWSHTKMKDIKGYACYPNKTKPYVVNLVKNKEHIYVGSFKSIVEAKDAYKFSFELAHIHELSKNEILSICKEKYQPHIKSNTGIKGVYLYKDKYLAKFMHKRKVIRLGLFTTPEEAHAAYLKAKEEYKNEMV